MASEAGSSTDSSVRDSRFHLALTQIRREICECGIPLFRNMSVIKSQGKPLVLEAKLRVLPDGGVRAELMQPNMVRVGERWVPVGGNLLAWGMNREDNLRALLDLLFELRAVLDAESQRYNPDRPGPGYRWKPFGFEDGIKFWYVEPTRRTLEEYEAASTLLEIQRRNVRFFLPRRDRTPHGGAFVAST